MKREAAITVKNLHISYRGISLNNNTNNDSINNIIKKNKNNKMD